MATGLRLQFVKHGAYGWNKGHAGVAGRFAEFVVQAGKQQAFPEVKDRSTVWANPLRESRKYSASALPMRLRRNPIRMLLRTS